MNLALASAVVLLAAGGIALIGAAAASAPKSSTALGRRIDMVAAVRITPAINQSSETWTSAAGRFFETVFAMRAERGWGVHSHGGGLLVLGLVAAASVWTILARGLNMPAWIAALLAAGAFVLVPHLKLAREQHGAEARFTDQFPDAIDSIIRMLRAGLPISAAIRAVAADASPPVDAVFKTVADQMDLGVTLETALANAGRRIDLADFRFFAVAVALQHSTGGNLTTTLDILSEIIRKRRGMRLKASAVTAEVRMTAYVLAAIPVVVVLGLLVVNPDYLSPLIHDPRGNMIIAAAVGSLAMGFFTMQRMMHNAIRM